MEVPIVIICYNNYKYVDIMINQINKFIYRYKVPIWIINNNSNCKNTIDYLNKTQHKVIDLITNQGHNAWASENIFNLLPNKFIVTDPDLKFNEALPINYIDTLINISDKYNAERVGFALDISDPEKMFAYKFSDFKSEWHHIPMICDSQRQYWVNKINDDKYDIYCSPIDTTFHLFNKNNKGGMHIRVAGNFTCKHLPWYKNIDGISRYQRYMMYNDANDSSSIKFFELQFIKDNKISLFNK